MKPPNAKTRSDGLQEREQKGSRRTASTSEVLQGPPALPFYGRGAGGPLQLDENMPLYVLHTDQPCSLRENQHMALY